MDKIITSFTQALSAQSIFFAAILAFFLTWVYFRVSAAFKTVLKQMQEVEYGETEFNKIFEKCCILFPIDTVTFKGVTFRRGAQVKVVTAGNKTIVAKLAGKNEDNFICLITKQHIVAEILENIKEITLYEPETANKAE